MSADVALTAISVAACAALAVIALYMLASAAQRRVEREAEIDRILADIGERVRREGRAR